MRSTTSFWTTIYDDSSECGSGFVTGNEGESSVKKYRVTINSFGKLQGKIVSATSEEDAVKKSGYGADLKPKAASPHLTT